MTEEGEGFHETHMRMTTYVEKPLRERMEKMKERGEIKSYARLVNKALKQYLGDDE